jgi:hypothetical protein
MMHDYSLSQVGSAGSVVSAVAAFKYVYEVHSLV